MRRARASRRGPTELEALEEVALVRGDAAGAGDGRALDLDAVTLDLAQRRQRVMAGAQAFAQDAMQDQGEKADQCVRANALGQAVMDRRDVEVGLEHAEAALDVGARSGAVRVRKAAPRDTA